MMSIIQWIAGVSFFLAVGFIVLFFKDYLTVDKVEKEGSEEEAFCEINVENLIMNNQKYFYNSGNVLSKKIQEFKHRNRFYKM
ncbi:hypothetical protein [Maribacter sp. ACAM166]|uniref:hypothetical protein n=1 Tax=Maribacter sp. ACAM166 TaxID=2508996 RepID=UPI0010FF30B6|nr:hypothetical protein [Maribacter sp. ACAM166]TLP70616.1 hypothetical protein ES765_20630 [Maribacter sp. ACAM166]